MKKLKFSFTYVFLILFAFSTKAFSSESYECEFKDGFVTTFENNKKESETGTQIKNIVSFSSLDSSSSSAIFAGNAGQTSVMYSKNEKGIHFLEITEAGNYNLTTIFLPALKSGNYAVVHSRHVAIYNPLPSQSVGYCLKK